MRTSAKVLNIISVLMGLLAFASAEAAGKIQVHNACIPIMTDRQLNVVAEICIETEDNMTLQGVELQLGGELPAHVFREAQLIYTGGMSSLMLRSESQAIKDQFKRIGGSQTMYAHPAYIEKQSLVKLSGQQTFYLRADRKLVPGKNYFYVSLAPDVKRVKDLSQSFTLEVTRIDADGGQAEFTKEALLPQRLGVGVRQHGDDGVYAYRIPGLVTSNEGTLLGIYDIRWHTSLDLQDDIDVGLSRSTDGGRTWQKMQVIMDMGKWGTLPEGQNGVGDPAILVDETTGEIFVVGLWVHGIGNGRAWTGVGQGLTPDETAQLMIVSSRDDGRTWSAPRNITTQIKDPSWRMTFQGPGRGITMQDGTLVFAMQHIDSVKMPHSGIMYSKDHGKTWQTHTTPLSNTTEAQVAEIEPGVLLLSMRNNRKTGRALAVTRDMGRTWEEHPASGALREPVCMAGLLQVPASRNVLGRDVLLFSNPDTTKGRNHMAIKASLDGGATWLPENRLLIDEEENWGYSCLTMVDPSTIGILYEGSTGQMVYQSLPLKEVVRRTDAGLNWTALPPFAAGGTGVSAAFAGDVDGRLVVAGGANFPGVPAAAGGKKAFYAGIYSLNATTNSWQQIGEMPAPAAYGVSYAVPGALIVAGGSNAQGALNNCYRITSAQGTASVVPFAALPFAVEQAAGVAKGEVLYLIGGITDGVPSAKLLACDLRAAAPEWTVVGEMPEPFVQPVIAAAGDALYVWGGFDPAKKTVANHGYRYDLATGAWERIAGTPDGGTLVGAAAVTLADGRIVLMGGVDRKVFTRALKLDATQLNDYLSQLPAYYDFRQAVYVYDTQKNEWNCVATSGRSARAGAALCVAGGELHLIGGETRPGVRTTDARRVKITE